MKLTLLSNQKNNTKIGKNKDENFIIWSLNLKPAKTNIVGVVKNICPFYSESCINLCVGTNGHFSMKNGSAYKAQLRKTTFFHQNKKLFFQKLFNEIAYCKEYANKRDATAVFRLNAYSDLNFAKLSKRYKGYNIYKYFSDCIFYDYTKDVKKFLTNNEKNYYLTYSHSERTLSDIRKNGYHRLTEFFNDMAKKNKNIAVVYEVIPNNDFSKNTIIDGDIDDNRFLDKKGIIVALKFKGSKKKLLAGIASGFVIPKELTVSNGIDLNK